MTETPGALSRVPLAELPAHVRRVLGGVDDVLVHRIDMNVRFRKVTSREGLLVHGEYGWGEAAPFWDYGPAESSIWLLSAVRAATAPSPVLRRSSVPVNVTIPVVSPNDAYARVLASGGCATAKVKVADPGAAPADDIARVEAVARALADTIGPDAQVRVDANGAWDEAEAVAAIREFDAAAHPIGGLQYVEQPCPDVEGLAAVRARVDVPIAADESIRRAEDPLAVARAGAADVAVIKVAPLGGIDRALEIGAESGLRLVVSSALESSVGLATGVRAAAALPGPVLACGLATGHLLAADVCVDPLRVAGGELEVRDIAPDLDLLDAPGVGADVLERWIARLDAMCEAIERRRS